MLDLGAWAAVQAKVEEKHCKLVMKNNVLARSVEYGFYKMLDCLYVGVPRREP